VRNPFSVPAGSGIGAFNLPQRRAAHRVLRLCEDQPGPSPRMDLFETSSIHRLADHLEQVPGPSRRPLVENMRETIRTLWARQPPGIPQDLPEVVRAVEDSLGPPAEAAQRMRLLRILAQNGQMAYEQPIEAVRRSLKLIDLAMRQPEGERESFTHALGRFNKYRSDSLDQVFEKLQPFPRHTWESVAYLCSKENYRLEALESLSEDIQRFPLEQREEVLKTLAPLRFNHYSWAKVLDALPTLPQQQWQAHAASVYRSYMTSPFWPTTIADPEFGLFDRSGNVIRPPDREALRANRANVETTMYAGEIAWAKDAIDQLLAQVKKPTLTASATVDEVLAEIARLRAARPTEGEQAHAGVYGSRGGTLELDHAERTLIGARKPGDYTDSLRDNLDFVTQARGEELRVGDLLAHLWHAAKRYAPKGVSDEERDRLRAQFKREIIDRLGKCIEIDAPLNADDPPTTHRVCPIGVRRYLAEVLQDRLAHVEVRTHQEPGEFMYVAKAGFKKELEREPADEYGVSQPLANRLHDWSNELKAQAAEVYADSPESIAAVVKQTDQYSAIWEPVAGPTRPRKAWLEKNEGWRKAHPRWVEQNQDWINYP
jgi:hypothetical protein